MSVDPVRLQFEPNLGFQLAAVRAVADVFDPPGALQPVPVAADALVAGNAFCLDGPRVLRGLQRVQQRHGLPVTRTIAPERLDLTVSMETGTGKTYVFLRTIHTLHQRHGLAKFIVVVPSLAVKEGVLQALSATADHFAHLFEGARIQAFAYDARRLGAVRAFATSGQLQVMVATIQALHQSHRRVFHQPREDLGDHRPIDLIRALRPVVVVDEPQSVDGGPMGRGRQALEALRPLVTLRYSATHRHIHHLVFRLDAIDAFERGLVKRVTVASAVPPDAHARPFVHLLGIDRRGKRLVARVEVDGLDAAGEVRRQVHPVQAGDRLEQVTGRSVYGGMVVTHLERPRARSEHRMALDADGEERWLSVGDAVGDVDLEDLQRRMIRRTIAAHIARRARLRPRGIKVLSLFFIDAVRHYRGTEQADGTHTPGKYLRIFEEEVARVAHAFGSVPLADLHGGYFSQDRRTGVPIDTRESSAAGRAAAAQAYALIMRDKARLLSLDTPLEFIFSHSALREGWDNPNVFQICALRELSSVRLRRQSIGRGLRLCVGSDGRRVEPVRTDPHLNVLTVIASEGVRQFAAGLQHEVEAETGLRFGVVSPPDLASLWPVERGGPSDAARLHAWLVAHDYLAPDGRCTPGLRHALDAGTLVLPDHFAEVALDLRALLAVRVRGLDIRDADLPGPDHPSAHATAFRAWWTTVAPRLEFTVSLDTDALVAWCHVGLAALPLASAAPAGPLPNPVSLLQARTGLTRSTLARILTSPHALALFPSHPHAVLQCIEQRVERFFEARAQLGVSVFRTSEGAPLQASTTGFPASTVPLHGCPLPTDSACALPRAFQLDTPLGALHPPQVVLTHRGLSFAPRPGANEATSTTALSRS